MLEELSSDVVNNTDINLKWLSKRVEIMEYELKILLGEEKEADDDEEEPNISADDDLNIDQIVPWVNEVKSKN